MAEVTVEWLNELHKKYEARVGALRRAPAASPHSAGDGTEAEQAADLAALIDQEQRHAQEAALERAGQGNTTGGAGRQAVMVTTSEGLRVPQGFTARRTLEGGEELACARCDWTASLAPSGSGFAVEVMDRGGPSVFASRERAASAVWQSALQHAEGCKG